MKMPAAQPARPRTPPRDTRLREELRAHQRKLETLERNTLSMMSRSLASLSTATASSVPLPTAPVYEPPKPSAKVSFINSFLLGTFRWPSQWKLVLTFGWRKVLWIKKILPSKDTRAGSIFVQQSFRTLFSWNFLDKWFAKNSLSFVLLLGTTWGSWWTKRNYSEQNRS